MKRITIIEKIICLIVLILSYDAFSWSINNIPAAQKKEQEKTTEVSKVETQEIEIQEVETQEVETREVETSQGSLSGKPAMVSYPEPQIERFVGNEMLGEVEADGLVFTVYDNGAEVIDTCTYDTDFVIPETVEYKGELYEVKAIADQAFSYDAGVWSLIIPDTVTTVGNCAVKECKFLISVYISENLTYVGFGSFSGNGGAQMFIPPSIYKIGEDSFAYNYGEAIITSQRQYEHLLKQNPYIEARVEENVTQQEVYDAHIKEYESQKSQ